MTSSKQQVTPPPALQPTLKDTRDAVLSEGIQTDADEMADDANRSEQTFDRTHGIFDKL